MKTIFGHLVDTLPTTCSHLSGNLTTFCRRFFVNTFPTPPLYRYPDNTRSSEINPCQNLQKSEKIDFRFYGVSFLGNLSIASLRTATSNRDRSFNSRDKYLKNIEQRCKIQLTCCYPVTMLVISRIEISTIVL